MYGLVNNFTRPYTTISMNIYFADDTFICFRIMKWICTWESANVCLRCLMQRLKESHGSRRYSMVWQSKWYIVRKEKCLYHVQTWLQMVWRMASGWTTEWILNDSSFWIIDCGVNSTYRLHVLWICYLADISVNPDFVVNVILIVC